MALPQVFREPARIHGFSESEVICLFLTVFDSYYNTFVSLVSESLWRALVNSDIRRRKCGSWLKVIDCSEGSPLISV